jgi:integrase
MTDRSSHRRASGAIRRLPSGRWQARYTGPDGAMRTIGTFATKSEADQALAHEVSTMARGAWHDPRLGEQPLGEWFRGWIATRTDIAESTRALYEQVLTTWIDAPVPVTAASGRATAVHLGIRTLASLTPAAVREWNHAVTAESTRRVTERWERSGEHDTRVNAAIRAWAAASGAPLAPTGRIPGWARDGWVAATGGASVPARPLRRNAGQTAATQAVADELITANPCAIKGAGQRDAHDRVDRRTVSLEEMWALADGMPERYRTSVILAICSGLRAGELFALQRKHVDLAAGVVRVEQSLALGRTAQGWFSAPKTRAGKRTVVLPKIAVAALREHMTRFTPPGRDALLFGTQNGTPLSSGQRTTMFARARSAIGRDDLTWHDQRHSALTLVASTGATLPELMERAGHASPRAAIHYQHAVDDSQRRIAQRLDEVLIDRPRTA